jgi:hypothetical protein
MEQRQVSLIFNFYYTPAFFCRFIVPTADSPTSAIKIWTRHPAEVKFSDTESTLDIDLRKTPSSQYPPDTVNADDHINSPSSGFTTLGPQFPHAYAAGGVYASSKLPGVKPVVQGDLTAIAVRSGSNEIVRYHGFQNLNLGLRIHKSNLDSDNDIEYQLRVVYHAGSGSQDNARAPRKLFVERGVIYDPTSIDPIQRDNDRIFYSIISDPNTIHLEKNYAIDTAELDVPKKPSGSGERKFSERERGSPVTPNPQPPNFCVIGEHAANSEISAIASKLESRFLLLRNGQSIAKALWQYIQDLINQMTPMPNFTNLDLIGHSRARDGILKLGELALTPRVIEREFNQIAQRGILQILRVKSIRLLGCRTACTRNSRHSVETMYNCVNISAPSRIRIYASRADLFAVHYDAQGFRSDAISLLADDDIMIKSQPGDIPPIEDYPPKPPGDPSSVSDDHPSGFAWTTLSNANAAAVAAWSYFYWEEAVNFDKLAQMLETSLGAQEDNALLRADCEILLSTLPLPQSIDDFRMFDIILLSEDPRVRVYDSSGTAYCFRFTNKNTTELVSELHDIGIPLTKSFRGKHQLPTTLTSWGL